MAPAAPTTLAVSGGVQHNASGLSVNGWYARESNDPDPDLSGWMADVSWTGKMIDAGSTSLTISYGKWKFGEHGIATRYFAAVNQAVSGAATDLYAGVSYDTGDVQHPNANYTDGTFVGNVDGDPCSADADNAADTDPETCAVSRDGVFILIAGVRIRF